MGTATGTIMVGAAGTTMAGAAGTTMAGAAATGAGAAAIGVGAAGIGAAATTKLGAGRKRPKQNPARAGFCHHLIVTTTASISPAEAAGSNVAARTHDAFLEQPRVDTARTHNAFLEQPRVNAARTHDTSLEQPPVNTDHAALWMASAVGPSIPTGAAAACRIRCAKACNRACKQNCREKVLHVFSPHASRKP